MSTDQPMSDGDKLHAFAGRMSDTFRPQATMQPGDIWAATAKPMKGFGGARYRLTPEFLIIERGTVTSNIEQVRIAFVTDIHTHQTISQKARKIGDLAITVTHPEGTVERVEIKDIPNPSEVASIMVKAANAAREVERARQSTSFIQHAGTPVGTPQAPAPPAPATTPAPTQDEDPMAKLKQLGDLHAAGVLSDEEFQAAKASILARM